MMTFSAAAGSETISCPAAISCLAIDSISLWFNRQPIECRKTFISPF
jgi:hypothetical protein